MKREAGSADRDAPGRSADAPASCDREARRVLASSNHLLHLIAEGRGFPEILEAVVDAVEEHCPGALGSVMLLDDDGDRLHEGAAPRVPPAFRRVTEGTTIGPAAGSSGTAAYRGEAVVVEDVASDPVWNGRLREVALEQGLRAAWAQPVLAADRRVLGVLTVHYREPRRPTGEEREFVESMARLAGIAVERNRSEFRRRAAERRLLSQKSVLVELAKSDALADSDFSALCRRATEAAAKTLGVERVSVWLLNESRTVLRCECLYEMSRDRHGPGIELESQSYPRYFAALERGRSVVAHDAWRDPDTSEFAEGYLRPLGITSMLDAPIRSSGRLVGVVCHEHVGPRRVWAADEQDFAASVGDFVSLVLEAGERRRAEQAFRSAQEELLRQDFQARRQIEFELARIKDELVRQTRLATIGQVAASIAHELRNPLGAIRNAAYYLRRRVPADQPKWDEYLGIVEQEIRRADVTINDLLEMSQAKRPVKQPVDLEQVVQDAFDYLRTGAGVELRMSLDPIPFVVDADPGQLRQVVANLLSNAVDAMSAGGRLRVVARREEGFDVVDVRDAGPGIPAELRKRIFEPLVTTKTKGTGLGLPICRQIVERHGGTLEALEGDGSGAVLRVRLPGGATG